MKVPSENIVLEIDQKRLQSRPVGLVADSAKVEVVVRALKRTKQLMRPNDILDIAGICRRTGRHKSTIVGKWMKKPDWPAPVVRIGGSDGYYWFDILDFLRRHNLPAIRKTTPYKRKEHDAEDLQGVRHPDPVPTG